MGSTLTVSQLNERIASKFTSDGQMKNIAVTGEISNARVSGGHLYFTLGEHNAAISAVMFSSNLERLMFEPEDGTSVIAIGNVEFYQKTGKTQIKCTAMAPVGAGGVQAAVERTRKKLEAMGIFDQSHKKPLPKSPRRIGVVTSRTGDVIHDIINVVRSRCGGAEIVVSPATMQGEYAEKSVCDALRRIDSAGCDVLILARGGGSAEDLMTFNSERITLAVYNCNTPIISALGHETNTPLADYAADMRAATPSAAAMFAVPETQMLGQRLSMLIKDMKNLMRVRVSDAESGLSGMTALLQAGSPEKRLQAQETLLQRCRNAIEVSVNAKIEKSKRVLAGEYARLDALNPLAVLSRGYAIVTDSSGRTVKKDSVSVSDTLNIRTGELEMTAQVLTVNAITDGE